MDHHCPWLNNCVGHFNYRYFFLFLVSLSIGCLVFIIHGTSLFLNEFWYRRSDIEWPNELAPVLFILLYCICIAIGIAVFMMACWHGYLIGTGQTTIDYYNNRAKREHTLVTGQVFVNEYDLGTVRNFKEFFNIGRHRHWTSVLIPVPCLPSGDGTKFVTFAEFIREEI